MRKLLPVVAAAIMSLFGCDTSYKYVRPNISPDAAATITGSRPHNPDGPDPHIYLVAIDGKLTLDGPFGWDHQTAVMPGAHSIKFGVATGSLLDHAGGFGETQATLEPGKLYTIKANDPLPINPICAKTVGWIEDESGRAITGKVPVFVGTATGGEIGTRSGAVITIPSRTTCPPD
jgi:hypothetical protein